MTHYIAKIDLCLQDIPCVVGVVYLNRVKGSFSYDAASDMDYHGYVEREYDLLTLGGSRATWLESILKDEDRAEIDRAIDDHFMENQDHDYTEFDL